MKNAKTIFITAIICLIVGLFAGLGLSARGTNELKDRLTDAENTNLELKERNRESQEVIARAAERIGKLEARHNEIKSAVDGIAGALGETGNTIDRAIDTLQRLEAALRIIYTYQQN